MHHAETSIGIHLRFVQSGLRSSTAFQDPRCKSKYPFDYVTLFRLIIQLLARPKQQLVSKQNVKKQKKPDRLFSQPGAPADTICKKAGELHRGSVNGNRKIAIKHISNNVIRQSHCLFIHLILVQQDDQALKALALDLLARRQACQHLQHRHL